MRAKSMQFLVLSRKWWPRTHEKSIFDPAFYLLYIMILHNSRQIIPR